MSRRPSYGSRRLITQQHIVRFEAVNFAATITSGYVTADNVAAQANDRLTLDGVGIQTTQPTPIIKCEPTLTVIESLEDGGFVNGITQPSNRGSDFGGRWELFSGTELRFYDNYGMITRSGNYVGDTCLLTQYRPGVIRKMQRDKLTLAKDVASATITFTYPIAIGQIGYARLGSCTTSEDYTGANLGTNNTRWQIQFTFDAGKRVITAATFSRIFAYGDAVTVGYQFWEWGE